MRLDFKQLLGLYQAELLERTIPFWLRYGVDWKNGGICTCISDDGQIQSQDKYMWSQLRAIYAFSALYNKIERRQEWLDVARQIYEFVIKCGRDELGQWVFLVDKDGNHLQGATSIYADAFAIYGLTELAKATHDHEPVDIALQTYENVCKRMARPGSYPTAPHPIPSGMKAHGISMTFALVFEELGNHLNDRAIVDAALWHAEQVMTVYLHPERQRLYEFVNLDNGVRETPPGPTVVPGHILESMWFMIHVYLNQGNSSRVRQAIDAMKWAIEFGWDAEYGGVYQARNAQASRWEAIADYKIWWPQTEALYALLLAYSISREQWCLDWFERVHDYAFKHFPVAGYGEWIQNLDRYGNKLNASVALPVKDPFHLSRSLMNNIGLLEQLAKE